MKFLAQAFLIQTSDVNINLSRTSRIMNKKLNGRDNCVISVRLKKDFMPNLNLFVQNCFEMIRDQGTCIDCRGPQKQAVISVDVSWL